MHTCVTSSIMPRTTIDIDATVLRELKRLGRKEGKTLGQLASELLTRALAREQEAKPEPAFTWASQDMGARVDLEDDEAVRAALEGD